MLTLEKNLERKKILVTIGLCVKNAERTISQTIKSILVQDYPSNLIDLIVVDGQSTDSTIELIRDILSMTLIHVSYYSDFGLGLGLARQIVVDNAQGKYIIWVDGDIFLTPSYVREQVSFMEQNSKVGASRGIELPAESTNLSELEYASKIRYYEIVEKKTLSTLGAIFRTDAIRNVGGFDKSIKGAQEDIDATFKMKCAGWSLLLNESKLIVQYRDSWLSLFKQCKWYGFGGYILLHKHALISEYWTKIFPVNFFVGFLGIKKAYHFSHKRIVVLLPIYRTIKDFFWWIGFIQASLKN